MHQRLIRDLWMVPQTTPLFKLQIPTPPISPPQHHLTALLSQLKIPASPISPPQHHSTLPLSQLEIPTPPSLLCDIMSLPHCPNWKFPHPHLSSTTSHHFPTILIGNLHTPYLSSTTPHNCSIVLIGNPCTPQLSSATWLHCPTLMIGHPCASLHADSYSSNTPTSGSIEDTLGGQEMDWEEMCKYHQLIIHELIIDGFIFKLLLNVVAHPWPLPTYSTQF